MSGENFTSKFKPNTSNSKLSEDDSNPRRIANPNLIHPPQNKKSVISINNINYEEPKTKKVVKPMSMVDLNNLIQIHHG
jgi:hypothetical protein